jgi:hypothetical protein
MPILHFGKHTTSVNSYKIKSKSFQTWNEPSFMSITKLPMCPYVIMVGHLSNRLTSTAGTSEAALKVAESRSGHSHSLNGGCSSGGWQVCCNIIGFLSSSSSLSFSLPHLSVLLAIYSFPIENIPYLPIVLLSLHGQYIRSVCLRGFAFLRRHDVIGKSSRSRRIIC